MADDPTGRQPDHSNQSAVRRTRKESALPTWIRVKDDVTGDEYDVEETSLRRGMTPIEGYPENSGPAAQPRPPKPLVRKDGAVTAPTAGGQAKAKTTSTPAEPANTSKEKS